MEDKIVLSIYDEKYLYLDRVKYVYDENIY